VPRYTGTGRFLSSIVVFNRTREICRFIRKVVLVIFTTPHNDANFTGRIVFFSAMFIADLALNLLFFLCYSSLTQSLGDAFAGLAVIENIGFVVNISTQFVSKG